MHGVPSYWGNIRGGEQMKTRSAINRRGDAEICLLQRVWIYYIHPSGEHWEDNAVET